MSMRVRWSDQLELLADGLYEAWASERGGNIFRKSCIVVGDKATENWLKSRYLMDTSHRQVLMNLEFIPLQEFVNNWLFAKTHDEPLSTRSPKTHPYAKEVLAWRIYRILSEEAELDTELAPLRDYVGANPDSAPLRRHALAEQLAILFDEYLSSRFALLHNWENGEKSSLDAELEREGLGWQKHLYRRLIQEEPGSYARDYYAALSGACTGKATEKGFPDYLSVHVFDIPDMPEPTLSLLEKISEEMEVTIWSFNPCGDWLADTPSKREAIRQLLAHSRQALKRGENPPEPELEAIFGPPADQLLGNLGMGGRAVLGAQVDRDWASQEMVLGEPGKAFAGLKTAEVAIHSCYSPKRELEAIRDGLHHFFKEHPKARPHEALVLCGDWESYAPILETVFSNDPASEDYLPVTVAGGLTGETPMTRSFQDLLAFRENRFEVSALFALLGVPAIRRRFGLDEDDLDTLQEMVLKANIHWGLDDAHVDEILGLEKAPGAAAEHYPYTWRRGLDRLALDMLCGDSGSDAFLMEAGNLGELMPTGNVENERAQALKALDEFVSALAQLRREFAKGQSRTADEWRLLLLEAIRRFYDDGDSASVNELKRLRTAIQSEAESARAARLTAPVPSDVFVTAVLSNLKGNLPGMRTPADAVLFAPLRSASATPHRMVWICGLNDGRFPRIDYRPSFNVIGKHPSLFDVSSRDRDGFALLKAVLSARGHLALSYVGTDIRSNERIPSSVMLSEVADYLKGVGNAPRLYRHPLQGFSSRYFVTPPELPPSYSASNYRVARALQNRDQAAPDDNGVSLSRITAFELNETGETTIPSEELAEFFAWPNGFLVKKRLNVNITWITGLNDEDAQSIDMDRRTTTSLLLAPTDVMNREKERLGKLFVEMGKTPDKEEATAQCLRVNQGEIPDKWRAYPLQYAKANMRFSCPEETIVGAYRRFLSGEAVISPWSTHCDVRAGDETRRVAIPYTSRLLALETATGERLNHTFFIDDNDSLYSSTKAYAWIMHVIGHAAGGGPFASILFCQPSLEKNDQGGTIHKAVCLKPLERPEAQALLEKYLALACNPIPPEYPDFNKVSKKEDEPFGDILDDVKQYSIQTAANSGRG